MSATPPEGSLNGDVQTAPQAKKRASQACHQCRSRKIKCDLVDTGAPCHNCQLDHIECTTSLSRRTRKYRLQKAQLLRNSVSSAILLPKKQEQGDEPLISPSAEPKTSPVQFSLHPSKSVQVATPPHQLMVGKSFCLENLPDYIGRPLHEIKSADLEYLSQCGALSVPYDELRDQLLRSVALYVCPFLPVLDLQELLDGVDGKHGCKISLILFQAVMFAGTAFVDLQYLLDAGFENRISARAHFAQKIKLLYDVGWETDRVILIQSLLHYVYWYVSSNDQKDPPYWLGICLSLAAGIGLNVESTYDNLDVKTSRLWRRIWWSCVSRDRISCIATRKPMRIKCEETNLPVLKFKDFDTQPLTTTIALLEDSPILSGCVNKVMLADMFMSKLSLLMIAGEIITYTHQIQRFDSSTTEWAMFYVPKPKHDLDPTRLDELQNKLERWSHNLNNYCQLNYQDDDDEGESSWQASDSSSAVLLVHRAALKLLYLMAQEALLRPLTFPQGLEQRFTSVCTKSEDNSTIRARTRVSRVATEMGGIFREFRQKNLLGYLPPLSVGCVLTAVASFLVDIRMELKSPVDVPGHQYHDCVQSLMKLRDVWPIAEGTWAMVNQMTTNNQIWYARCLKMLCKPLSTVSKQTPVSEKSTVRSPDSTNQESQKGNQLQHTGDVDRQGSSQLQSTLEHRTTSINSYNPHMSNYLASMYPFPWSAADFDVFDPSTYQELFTDHALDNFELSGTFETPMQEYPVPVGQQVEEQTQGQPTTTPPHLWR
ncbi:hypothetical protein LTR84_001461 [Exophiala bonariae]|uniref:Zn(2)-C6 fungal-type domain-containing protein n=1 Tax=Exophiala bonariae TaxID=1690606 RepID=A0AAV9NDU9_9EURO|nr:hypothetical protein LTR84_001461 [Exophiala bonariae]